MGTYRSSSRSAEELAESEVFEAHRFEEDDFSDFRDPGGRSALRKGKRIYACPSCGMPNALTAKDKSLGYQCDSCADRDEGIGGSYAE